MNNVLITEDAMDLSVPDTDNSFNEFNSNCLALTIRKEYRFTVFSNAINTIKRVSLKIFFNISMLNFLGLIF